jgi:carbon monoxide dehydrogenase subunit G
MKIDSEFTVSVPIERAWEVLTDLEGIAPCMPGAQLTGVDGDVYSGKVRVKVGQVISEYAGTVRFLEKDDAGYRAVIDAKGRDSRGAGNASANITAALHPDGAHTVVTVNTDLRISGKIAQLGGGMIKEVSTKLLGQFAASLEAMLAAEPAPTAPDVPANTVSAASPDQATHGQASSVSATAEPLELMELAGASVYKRLIPVAAVAVVIIVVVLVWALA